MRCYRQLWNLPLIRRKVLAVRVHRLLLVCVLCATGISQKAEVQSPGAEQAALKTAVNGPANLAIYDNYLYVLEHVAERVLRVNLQTDTVRVFAGNGRHCCHKDGVAAKDSSLHGPRALAIDSHGNVFIGEVSGFVRRVAADSGIISTVAGDGQAGDTQDGVPARSAHFWSADSLTIDAEDNLYLTDETQGKIFKIDGRTSVVKTFAGNGKRGFTGDGQPATAASFRFPESVFDKVGNLVVADYENCRIRLIDGQTTRVSTIALVAPVQADGHCANPSNAPGPYPSDPAVDASNNVYFVQGAFDVVIRVNASNRELVTVAGQKQKRGFSGDGGLATKATLSNPSGLALDTAGNLYIAEYRNNRVRRVDAKTHRISTVVGNGLPHRIDTEM
jgi:sugar lactone lactonase YvrE